MEALSLEEIKGRRVDVFTTVYIGNSHTKQVELYMVTPRDHRHGKE